MKAMIPFMKLAPKVCSSIISNRKNLIKPLVDLYMAKEYKKIVIVASGSSSNIANSVKYFIQNTLNTEVKIIWPMTYIKFDYKFNEDAFIICMSQSGKSTNTIQAVKKANKMGQDVAVLTTNANSPIKQYTNNVFEYGSGSDDYYVAKGYPASCTFLMLFALETALAKNIIKKEEFELKLKELETAISLMKTSFEVSEQFYANNKEEFKAMRRVMVVGCGPSYGTALEGALKINETFGIPTNAYEMEEFVHGPSYEIFKDHAVFFIDNGDDAHERIMQLYSALHLLTDKVFLISNNGNVADKRIWKLDYEISNEFSILFNIIPFQIISDSICSDLDLLSYNVRNYEFEKIIKTKA
ncbi:SIS domain-containing protein [Clostridium neuense]|uniref:SIS domain-containing protein n=1 Tax=Clostridium neuense TaxID=1728934 RepID=A0ABW8TAG2_9CLOT